VTAKGAPFPFPPDLDETPLRSHVPAYPVISVAEGIAATFGAFNQLKAEGCLSPLPR